MDFNIGLQREIDRAFEDIVKDIMYVFPHTSRETAEKSAITFIRYPKMLVELYELSKEKKMADGIL